MDTIHEMTADAALMPRFDDGMVNMTELIRVMAESLVNEIMDAQADEACEADVGVADVRQVAFLQVGDRFVQR